MPGADRPIDLVRLDSAGDTFAILGRFPAGFARPVPGGYAVAEEFLVLDGALELEGTTVEPGALCFIPAHHPRAPMRSPAGCTVLAWFAGPPVFRPAAELTSSPSAAVAMLTVGPAADGGSLLLTSETDWRIADARRLQDAEPPVDVVDLARTWWARVGAGRGTPVPAGPVLARLPVAGGGRPVTAPPVPPTSR